MGYSLGLQTNWKLTIMDNLKICPDFHMKEDILPQSCHLIPLQSHNTMPFPTQWLYAGLWVNGLFVMDDKIQMTWKLYKYFHHSDY